LLFRLNPVKIIYIYALVTKLIKIISIAAMKKFIIAFIIVSALFSCKIKPCASRKKENTQQIQWASKNKVEGYYRECPNMILYRQ